MKGFKKQSNRFEFLGDHFGSWWRVNHRSQSCGSEGEREYGLIAEKVIEVECM